MTEPVQNCSAESCDLDEGDILPCPFCGNPPKVEMTGFHLGGRTIRCEADDCMGPHTTAACVNDAVVQWNKRIVGFDRGRISGVAQPSPAATVETGVSYEAMEAALALGRPGIERMIEAIAKETGDRIYRHNGLSAVTEGVAKLGVQEVADAWGILESHGFPPEAVNWPEENIAGKLPVAIDNALTAIVGARDDLLAEVLRLRAVPQEVKVPVTEDQIETACEAYADATNYYVKFHRGLSSPSADHIRKGMRAALSALTRPHLARGDE